MLPQENIPLSDLRNYINDKIVPNEMRQIDGVDHNNVENALLTAIENAPLNSKGGKVITEPEDVFLTHGVTVFTEVPASIAWEENFQKQWKIVNRTEEDLPLQDGLTYIDQYGEVRDYIPASMALTIEQLESGQWAQTNNIGGGGSDVPNAAAETPSIVVDLSGAFNRTISADLKVSQDAGNGIEIRDDGVYAGNSNGTTQSFIVTFDSDAS